MLKGISPLFSPKLLATIYMMGHGDEIVLADAHYPGHSNNDHVIRADGLMIPELLDAIVPLFPLDQYVEQPVSMMAAVEGDTLDPKVEEDYQQVIKKYDYDLTIQRVERFDFYERSQKAFAIVMTGDTAQYANVILKKGLVTS